MATLVKETPFVIHVPKPDPFQQIPLEITLLILERLSLLDLTRASLTCREWNQIIESNKKKLWVPWALALRSFLPYGLLLTEERPLRSTYPLYKTKVEAYRNIYTDGKSDLMKIFSKRKTLLETLTRLEAKTLTCSSPEHVSLIDIEFACSQIGLIPYQNFLDRTKEYLQSLNTQAYKSQFITDRIESLVRARLFGHPMEQLEKVLQEGGVNDHALHRISTPSIQAISDLCDQNRIHEAMDLLEKRWGWDTMSYSSCKICLLSILQKSIELKDKESIWRLSRLFSKKEPNDPSDLNDLILSAIKNDLYPLPVKSYFDVCNLFKDDPAIKFRPPLSIVHIMSLIDEGCDAEAIELYKILPLGRERQIQCLDRMAALFEAKGLSRKAEMVRTLYPT
jgi:hypothetical protein